MQQLVNNLKNSGKMIGKAFAVGTASAIASIGVLVKKSVDAYAEFEQLNGGLEALFGKGSENMQKVTQMSEEAYKKLTLSQNAYLKAFEGSYSIINNGIGKNADAVEYTNKMIQMSTDLYNTYGGAVETYQSAINWALKGTYSYLDNLNVGIKGTKEGFIEAANKSGILNKNIKDTSELTNDQILDVIQYYVKSAGAFGRTEEEASKTIQGSMNMAKASWENLLAGFSNADANLDKLFQEFINSASTFITNVLPIVETAINSVLKVLPRILEEISSRLPSALTKIASTLIAMLPTLINIAISLIKNLIDALIQVLPTLIPQLITAIIDGFLTILDNIDLLIDCGIQLTYAIIDGLINALPILIEKAPIIIIKLTSALIKNVPKLISFAMTLPMKIWEGIVKKLPELIKKIPSIITKSISALKKEVNSFNGVGGNIIKGLWNGMSGKVDWVISKVKGLGKSILNGLKGVLGIKSPSKEFAILGKFSILGYEEGLNKMQPELQKSINSMFDLSPSMNGTMNNTLTPTINVSNNVNVETDPLGQVVNKIKTFSGGAKNDYNYGYGG